MNKIKHLNADQLARHARNVFISGGRQKIGAALIYRCLEMDPRHVLGLRCLSDMLDTDGTEHFSAAILEYILNGAGELTADERREIDDLLFLSKWTWGFAAHVDDRGDLKREDFQDRSKFKTDEAAYQAFLKELRGQVDDDETLMRGAHVLVGVLAGILKSRERGNAATMDSIFGDEIYDRDASYHEFMDQSTDDLDKLREELKQ